MDRLATEVKLTENYNKQYLNCIRKISPIHVRHENEIISETLAFAKIKPAIDLA